MSEADDNEAGEICRLQETLYSERGNFNSNWQSVAEHVLPNHSDFTTVWTDGQRRTNRIFDSTAPLALEHGCAALESMSFPSNQIYHRLRPREPELQGDASIQQYCDQVNDCLFRARYAPGANFQAQGGQTLSQLMAFGTGAILIDDVVGYGLRYRALHLAQTFGIENSAGVIDHIHWKREWTASACVDAYNRGMFDTLPAEIEKKAASKPMQKYTFIQAIRPNQEVDKRAKDYRGMAFVSTIVCTDLKEIVKRGGYRTQPILMPRYNVALKETYGRGPGLNVLPEILMLNEMAKVQIRQAQRIIEPPLLLGDDGVLGSFSLRGNALNYGWLNQDGKPLALPLQTGGNYEVSKDLLDNVRQRVQMAFLNGVFSILDQHPEMTATEVLERAQEQGYLVAPIVGRMQTEWFGPMIERELDILDRAGQLPPPPQKLKQRGGINMEVVYESQIQVNQRKTKAAAIAATIQQIEPLLNIDPTVAKVFNPQRMAQIIGESNGAPAAIFNTDDEMQAEKDAQMQQQQITNLAQMAGPGSQAIKNIADAQKAGLSVSPGAVGP